MTLSTITFVDDDGNVRDETIASDAFSIKVDGQLYSPAVATNVEMENDPDSSPTHDQCGHASRNRTAESGWIVRVSGIVTNNDARDGNLSLQMLRDVVAPMEEVEIRGDMWEELTIELSNLVLTNPNDLVEIQTTDSNGKESAYEFQLQLGESESE